MGTQQSILAECSDNSYEVEALRRVQDSRVLRQNIVTIPDRHVSEQTWQEPARIPGEVRPNTEPGECRNKIPGKCRNERQKAYLASALVETISRQ